MIFPNIKRIVFPIYEVGYKGILANHVLWNVYVAEIMRTDFRGVYDTKRGGDEVGVDYDLKSMNCGIATLQVAIKRL